MRRLSAEERAVWGRVAGTVRPVAGRKADLVPRHPELVSGSISQQAKAELVGGWMLKQRPAGSPLDAVKKPASRTQNTLDGSWDKRLRLGQAAPDFTIDLHGETLSSAHARLNRSLAAAIRSEARIILLITGRPAKDNPRLPPTSRGVIRATVGDWLAASPYASHIAAVRGAHPRHGGAGALYLILRRAR
jgi:DNA-nicking Smr family endonuclease